MDFIEKAKKEYREEKVSLRDICNQLNIRKKDFSRWSKNILKTLRIDAERSEEIVKGNRGSTNVVDYLISKKDVKRIITNSSKEAGKETRDKLVDQDNRLDDLRNKYNNDFFKKILDDPKAVNNLALALIEKNSEMTESIEKLEYEKKSLKIANQNKLSLKELRAITVRLVNEVAKHNGLNHHSVYREAYIKLMNICHVSWKNEFFKTKGKIEYLEKKGRIYLERLNSVLGAMI